MPAPGGRWSLTLLSMPSATEGGLDWRPLLAALANPDARRLYAELVLGTGRLDKEPDALPRKPKRALESLLNADLVRRVGQRLELNEDLFSDVLRADPSRTPPTGARRFLMADGRLNQYPGRVKDRMELLRFITDQVMHPSERLPERTLNERLAQFDPDTASLRRLLVDHGFLDRTPSGSEYAAHKMA